MELILIVIIGIATVVALRAEVSSLRDRIRDLEKTVWDLKYP